MVHMARENLTLQWKLRIVKNVSACNLFLSTIDFLAFPIVYCYNLKTTQQAKFLVIHSFNTGNNAEK